MERPKFKKLLEILKEGDTLVVCKLDRFARTAIEGVQTVRELFERGIRVHILNMGLIENTLTGNLILTVMLAFAEYERGMIVERTQTGKTVARVDPNFKDGRPKKFTPEQIQLGLMLLKQGKTYKQVKDLTGISKSTLNRARNVSVQEKNR
jgi:DNA invertase Pin-like site-specific DNA recombinase